MLTNVATVNGDQPEPVPDPHPNRDETITRVVVSRLPSAYRRHHLHRHPVLTVRLQPPVPPPPPPLVPPGPAGTKLALRKRASTKQAAAGETITYRLRVANTGEAAALQVRLCDTPQPGLTFVSTPGFQRSGGQACTTIARLEVGKSTTRTLTARVTALASTYVFNRARVQARNTGVARASAVVRVVGQGTVQALLGPHRTALLSPNRRRVGRCCASG